jgi:hypothetical protein
VVKNGDTPNIVEVTRSASFVEPIEHVIHWMEAVAAPAEGEVVVSETQRAGLHMQLATDEAELIRLVRVVIVDGGSEADPGIDLAVNIGYETAFFSECVFVDDIAELSRQQ